MASIPPDSGTVTQQTYLGTQTIRIFLHQAIAKALTNPALAAFPVTEAPIAAPASYSQQDQRDGYTMPDTRPSRLAALCPASSGHGCLVLLQTGDPPQLRRLDDASSG
jgi:hypothetical protein